MCLGDSNGNAMVGVQPLLRMNTARLCQNRGRREQAMLQRKQGRREAQQEPAQACCDATGQVTTVARKFLLQLQGGISFH